MRTIYCPGNLSFAEDLNDLYVDKTMLIDTVNARINGPKRCLCVTRPRRFGKTFAADMLTAYYDRSCDSESLFAPLKIGKSVSFRQHLNQYHVLRLDATRYISNQTACLIEGKLVPKVDLVERMRTSILRELLAAYPEASTKSTQLLTVLSYIVSETGTKFVVVLDEWDAFLREFPDSEDLKNSYLLFLRSLFKVPVTSSLFAAVYLTGVLPMKCFQSDFAPNNFQEITVLSPMATADLFGFTEEETRQYLSDSDLSLDDITAQYDGYQVEEVRVFNPFSISRARDMEEIGYHWARTCSFDALLHYITMDLNGLSEDIERLMAGIPVAVNAETASNGSFAVKTREHILTLLVLLGYLTYDSRTNTVRIPNHEIYWLFKTTITENKWPVLCPKIERSDKILAVILSEEAGRVAELIGESHEACSAQAAYGDHEVLKNTIREALLTAADAYDRWEAFPPRNGLAAILYLPKKHVHAPAILVELKVTRSSKSAIKQIKSLNSPAGLKDYSGEILLVGVSYNPKSRTHKCGIERYNTGKRTLIVQ